MRGMGMYDLCQYISEWLSIRAESEEITKMIWGRGNATILLSKWLGGDNDEIK